MLLRSSSSPLLKQQYYSCLPQEPKKYLSTLSSLSKLECNSVQKKMSRVLSETDLNRASSSNSSNSCCMALHNLILPTTFDEEDKEDEVYNVHELLEILISHGRERVHFYLFNYVFNIPLLTYHFDSFFHDYVLNTPPHVHNIFL